MSRCLACDKFNDLADENEIILLKYNKLQHDYNWLKCNYDKYDEICYEYGFVGFALGIIITLIIATFISGI